MKYCAVLKKEVLPFVAIWMNLKDIMLSEEIQTRSFILSGETNVQHTMPQLGLLVHRHTHSSTWTQLT